MIFKGASTSCEDAFIVDGIGSASSCSLSYFLILAEATIFPCHVLLRLAEIIENKLIEAFDRSVVFNRAVDLPGGNIGWPAYRLATNFCCCELEFVPRESVFRLDRESGNGGAVLDARIGRRVISNWRQLWMVCPSAGNLACSHLSGHGWVEEVVVVIRIGCMLLQQAVISPIFCVLGFECAIGRSAFLQATLQTHLSLREKLDHQFLFPLLFGGC
uniref:Uncharacterized protein n=1 Tax=Ananas comosus var. bracteatus TaxID=296719 RepID=A0A6V7P4F7_ANACO|nr:unnamed protein product [Ananas comosus var. bracteatus]